MKRIGVVKHTILFLVITATGMNLAQPRAKQKPEKARENQAQTLEPSPNTATQELTACISNLQQTGQLTPKQDKDNKKNNETEEQAFTNAANGIFAGVLTVISGATAGDPKQIAIGIFSMLSAAFAAATRGKVDGAQRDEVPHEDVIPVQKRSHRATRTLTGQELRALIARYQQQNSFKRRI